MKVVKLVDFNKNAKSWGVKDVCSEFEKECADGDYDAAMVIMRTAGGGMYKISFIQSGMSAEEMIALLEVTKMQIYTDHMNAD